MGDDLCGTNGSSDSCLACEFAIHRIHSAPGESVCEQGMGNLSFSLLLSLLQHLHVTYTVMSPLMSVDFNSTVKSATGNQ